MKSYGPALCAALLLAADVAQAAGSWMSTRSLADIQRRGQSVTTRLTPDAGAPTAAGARITQINWRQGYDRLAGPYRGAKLCAAGRCLDASAPSGHSHVFAGLAADTVFSFHTVVPGQGKLAPGLHAGTLQLVVDYD